MTASRLIIVGSESPGFGVNGQTGAELMSQLPGVSPWLSPWAESQSSHTESGIILYREALLFSY